MSKRERFHGRVSDGQARPCDQPGCDAVGEFRAPRPRGQDGYYHFCLDHVRAYNASYDFFDGMTPDQMQDAASRAYTWDRPTWRIAGTGEDEELPRVDDVLGMFDDLPGYGAGFLRAGRRAANGRRVSRADLAALKVLGLDADAEAKDIRNRYRTLVRSYHPDSHGGDRRHESKLRAVIAAYKQLTRAPGTADAG
ncbi:hypothetical protein CCR85_06655 [Rhodothalassium salexigens]|uniref:J domain-containing protein n=1 Tax=Rhodothalassium salexigens TaxID=1086 RepID=UPI0019120E36|nr:DnaJ domain-containing protein [Rhodothalassium salexigens]MBK5911171.1 hypothetical protein [Rhodothalassium salexigens]MBK5921939.1 hypothetical protein [Rhodothalassium salexigens]